MSPNFQHGAHVVATDAHTLRTLTIRESSFIVITSGLKRLHKPDAELQAGRGQGVAIAHGTQWDVTNDPHGTRAYQALALSFPAELLQEFRTLEGAATIPAVHAATVADVDDELFDAMQRTLPPATAQAMGQELLMHRIMEVLLLLGHAAAASWRRMRSLGPIASGGLWRNVRMRTGTCRRWLLPST